MNVPGSIAQLDVVEVEEPAGVEALVDALLRGEHERGRMRTLGGERDGRQQIGDAGGVRERLEIDAECSDPARDRRGGVLVGVRDAAGEPEQASTGRHLRRS